MNKEGWVKKLIDYEYCDYTHAELLEELAKYKYKDWPREEVKKRYKELTE